MNPTLSISANLIFGVICALVADSRGRSALGWFFIGFLFSCFGLVLLLVLPDEDQTRQRREHAEREAQRLREVVRKDREVADRRSEETSRRLDAHDRAIGLDTRGPTPVELTEEQARALGDPSPPPIPRALSVTQASWFYLEDTDEERVQRGPVAFVRLRELFERGEVDGTTLVWREGMGDWAPVDELRDLSDGLRA